MSVQPGLQAPDFGFQFGSDLGNLRPDFGNVGFRSNVAGDCIANGRYDGFGQWFRGASFAERLDGSMRIEGERSHARTVRRHAAVRQWAARLDTGRRGR